MRKSIDNDKLKRISTEFPDFLPYQYPEEIQETPEERTKGWDIFLKQLKKERKLK